MTLRFLRINFHRVKKKKKKKITADFVGSSPRFLFYYFYLLLNCSFFVFLCVCVLRCRTLRVWFCTCCTRWGVGICLFLLLSWQFISWSRSWTRSASSRRAPGAYLSSDTYLLWQVIGICSSPTWPRSTAAFSPPKSAISSSSSSATINSSERLSGRRSTRAGPGTSSPTSSKATVSQLITLFPYSQKYVHFGGKFYEKFRLAISFSIY